MNSSEIIKNIDYIYSKYPVPKNLQEHMKRAANVAEIICNNWIGKEKINKENIVASLLLHDLGNIVKFDLESELGIKIIGDEAKRLDYWKLRKKETIDNYGDDDHIVSKAMCEELNVDKRIIELIEKHVFNNNENTLNSNDFDVKIAAYSDQRIGPFSIMSLEDRFKELKERYANRKNLNTNNPKIDLFIDCAFKIEKQIFENVKIKPEDIK
jgi:5'-deoxynucleotidase YfbR-like HD superfamily hydrolase